ncbi:unnamed protein product [Rotaria sp. Silwood1]|nr:unnamed protein product [Rotaria sp. Silwood1]
MSRNIHQHEENERNPTTRLPSPVRQCVSNNVKCGLTEAQIKKTLVINYPQASVDAIKLHSLITYERRKDRPEIFSVYDMRNWCNEHKESKDLHSVFVPFYKVDDINNLFVFFTTKQLFQQIRSTTLLQVDATYKLTWNNLPLLVFGSTDANRHFKPFGMALISTDEDSECFIHLFNSINALFLQEFNEPCSINQIMADGAPAITNAQNTVFPNSRRLMCWSHMIKKCRHHRNLVNKNDWLMIDKDIHELQLAFTDDIFDRGIFLLLQKWNQIPSMKQFVNYFTDHWVSNLRYWYEGAAYGKPSTNNGLESLNGIIKQKYTLRNKLHLSAFLPKVEVMLSDWSQASITTPFATVTDITSEMELHAYQWSIKINQIDILFFFNNFYIVPSSKSVMPTSTWLDLYISNQWTSFDHYVAWKSSCWMVSPLGSCTCPVGLKQYRCKHAIGLAIMFNIYKIKDESRIIPLGKRKTPGRPKKIRTAYYHN